MAPQGTGRRGDGKAMESVAACPQDALAMIRAALALVGQAQGTLENLPGSAPEAQNLADSLLETRAVLSALEVTAGLLESAYRAGREDERAAAARGRGRLYRAV